jgi:hypothetical protein
MRGRSSGLSDNPVLAKSSPKGKKKLRTQMYGKLNV